MVKYCHGKLTGRFVDAEKLNKEESPGCTEQGDGG